MSIVLVSNVHRPTLRALAYARASKPDRLEALTVAVDHDEALALEDQWQRLGIDVPHKVLDSPYCEVTRPVVDCVRSLTSDDDLAGEATRISNRLRALMTRIHPHLERALGPRIQHPAVLMVTGAVRVPARTRKAGRRRLIASIRRKAPRMAERLVEEIFTALDEQQLPQQMRVAKGQTAKSTITGSPEVAASPKTASSRSLVSGPALPHRAFTNARGEGERVLDYHQFFRSWTGGIHPTRIPPPARARGTGRVWGQDIGVECRTAV